MLIETLHLFDFNYILYEQLEPYFQAVSICMRSYSKMSSSLIGSKSSNMFTLGLILGRAQTGVLALDLRVHTLRGAVELKK